MQRWIYRWDIFSGVALHTAVFLLQSLRSDRVAGVIAYICEHKCGFVCEHKCGTLKLRCCTVCPDLKVLPMIVVCSEGFSRDLRHFYGTTFCVCVSVCAHTHVCVCVCVHVYARASELVLTVLILCSLLCKGLSVPV